MQDQEGINAVAGVMTRTRGCGEEEGGETEREHPSLERWLGESRTRGSLKVPGDEVPPSSRG